MRLTLRCRTSAVSQLGRACRKSRRRARAHRATQSLRFVVWVVAVSLLVVSVYFTSERRRLPT